MNQFYFSRKSIQFVCTIYKPPGRVLDVVEHLGQGLIEIFILSCLRDHVGKQFGGQDKEPLFLDSIIPSQLGLLVEDLGVVEGLITSPSLFLVDEGGEIFGDKAVEEDPEHIGFKVPTFYIATEVVGDLSDGAMIFCRTYRGVIISV